MRIIYGTNNPAKLSHMRDILIGLDIEIAGLDSIDQNVLPRDISEDGRDPLENARKKAKAYYTAVKSPVFSCDSGLYFDGLPDALQPGVNIRRVGGRRLSDGEMIAYYSALAKDNGGFITARYMNAICLIMGDKRTYEHMGEDISSKPFLIASEPHSRRVEGFPLDSLSVHIDEKRYYYDLKEADYGRNGESELAGGFYSFFKKVLDEC